MSACLWISLSLHSLSHASVSKFLFFKRTLVVGVCCATLGCSVMNDSLWPHGPYPTSLLRPRGLSRQDYWSGFPCPLPGDLPNPGIELRSPALQADSLPSEPPGKPMNTGAVSLSLLQGIFPTQESNRYLLHCRQILYLLSYQRSPGCWIRAILKVMTNLDSILKSRDITLLTKVHLVKAMVFPVVMNGCESWTEESWVVKNLRFWTVVLKKTLESPLDCKEIQPVHLKVLGIHWKDWCWTCNSNTLATLCEELTHWKRPWCWEGLAAGGKGDDRGWDGWMASPTQRTWVWVNSGSWWWTGRPGVLRFTGLQRVGHDWTTELNWTEYIKTAS